MTRAGAAAAACFAVWLGAEVCAAWLIASTWSQSVRPFTDSPAANARDLALGAVFAVVGLVLAARRPRNTVGWLLLGVALSLSVNVLLARYAVYGLLAHPGSLPGAAVAAALGASTWVILISSLLLLLLTFPRGRLPSPRWRAAVWILIVVGAATWIGNTLVPGPLTRPLNRYDNPLGIAALRSLSNALSAPGFLLVVLFGAAAVSLVQRFRRAQGDERQQFKWFTFAAVLFPVSLVVVQVADAVFGQASAEDTVTSTITGVVATAIPVATAVAVLRYRLYDIDQVISRTLVYGALSALLAGSYAGLVLGLQAAFGSVTQGNELAVACSTLAVAAMFRPLRRRLQTVVDRRFYRSKVNAEETLARFGSRLRHEADLETLLGDLQSVVGQTLAPAHVSLWLRPPEPGS